MSFVTASKPQTQYIQKLRNTTPPALLSNQAIKALLFLVVAVPALSALSPFKSLTHLTLVGLAVSLALYVHFPGSLVLPAVFATLLGSIDGGRHGHPTGHGDGSGLTEAFAKLRDLQHSLDCL
jgi:hypothetical protein